MKTILLLVVLSLVGSPVSAQTVTDTAVITHHETIPRLAADPDRIAIQSGLWSDPGTWGDSVPDCDSVESTPTEHVGEDVLIPDGIVVTYDLKSTTHIGSIEVSGVLEFSAAHPTCLYCDDITVMPGGRLEIGTEDSPAIAEVVFCNSELDLDSDPKQFGRGLIAFGDIAMVGESKTPYVRTASDVTSGALSAETGDQIAGWATGDRLVIPKTSQDYFGRYGMVRSTETEVAVCGGGLSWNAPLQFDHKGMASNPWGLTRFPHVANLSRSVVLRSEHPDGVRGHVMLHGSATGEFRNVEFRALGRTRGTVPLDNTIGDHIGENQVGRYPMHAHHLMGSLIVSGCTFSDNRKWGITIHDTDGALVENNVIYNTVGAGVMTEDAEENDNIFRGNLVIKVNGGHQRNDERQGVTFHADASGQQFIDTGADSSAYWFRGGENVVEGNFAYDAAGYGYNYTGYFRHHSDHPPGDYLRPILSFDGNEACACKGGIWLVASQGTLARAEQNYLPQSLSNFVGWNINHFGIRSYHEAHTTYDDMTIVFDPSVSSRNAGRPNKYFMRFCTTGVDVGNGFYEAYNLTFRNLKVSGANLGIATSASPLDFFDLLGGQFANTVDLLVDGPSQSKTNLEDIEHFESEVTPVPMHSYEPAEIVVKQ